MLCEVVLEYQDISEFRWLGWLQGGLMLVKSTCRRSRGAVAMMGCKGTLGKPPSCCKQHVQVLMDCHIWLGFPGHQKCSCNKDKVWSWPWCPASLWPPFRAATPCTLETMKSSNFSFLPLGIEHRYRAFWWIIKFWQFLQTSQPSLLEACCPKSDFRSVFFQASSQLHTEFSTGSSLCVLAQSVTCISTNTCPAATCTSFSMPMVTFNHCRVTTLFPMRGT